MLQVVFEPRQTDSRDSAGSFILTPLQSKLRRKLSLPSLPLSQERVEEVKELAQISRKHNWTSAPHQSQRTEIFALLEGKDFEKLRRMCKPKPNFSPKFEGVLAPRGVSRSS